MYSDRPESESELRKSSEPLLVQRRYLIPTHDDGYLIHGVNKLDDRWTTDNMVYGLIILSDLQVGGKSHIVSNFPYLFIA